MTSESIDAVSRVTWVVVAFVVIHDALFSESVVAAVAPEAADCILTLSVRVGAGCVTLVHIPLTVRTLPTIFTVLDTVHHTSVRVPGAVHVTVRAVVSLRAKEPGC